MATPKLHLVVPSRGHVAPEPFCRPSLLPGQAAQDGRPWRRPFLSPPQEEGAASSRPNTVAAALPRPPVTHPAPAAALPRRHLDSCHVSRAARQDPGGLRPPSVSSPGARPRSPDSRGSWRLEDTQAESRGHASWALVKPLLLRDAGRHAGRAQADNPSPNHGCTATGARPRTYAMA